MEGKKGQCFTHVTHKQKERRMVEILSLSLQMPLEPLLVDNSYVVYFLVPYDILLRMPSAHAICLHSVLYDL